MDPMLLIGIGVVAVGASLGALLMFGQRAPSLAEPVTEPAARPTVPREHVASTGLTAAAAAGTLPPDAHATTQALTRRSGPRPLPEHLRPPVPSGMRSSAVAIPWHRRLRSGVGLAVLVIGFGMAIGAVLGLGVVALNTFIG